MNSKTIIYCKLWVEQFTENNAPNFPKRRQNVQHNNCENLIKKDSITPSKINEQKKNILWRKNKI